MNTIETYTNLITSEHKNKPKFIATVQANIKFYVQLQEVLNSLTPKFDVDTAEGDQLDIIGLWAGISRFIRSPLQGIYFTWGDPNVYNFVSRATTGTYYGDDGLIKTAAINVARMQYNPLFLSVPPTLLLESSKTNLFLMSEVLNSASWSKSRSTITVNATTAPDGLLTADKLVEDTTASQTHTVGQTETVNAGTVYTFSFFVKKSERTNARLTMSTAGFGVGGIAPSAYFNLITGVVTAPTAAIIENGIQFLPDDWCRIWITSLCHTTTVGSSALLYLCAGTTTSSYTGDGVSGFFAWGGQLETGYISSYIPTELSEVTRAADVYTTVPRSIGWGEGSWKGQFSPDSGLTSLPDDVYRILIKAKIAANSWDGTIPGAYAIWETVFSDNIIIIQDNQDMSITVAVVGAPLDAITQALLTGGYIPLKPEGVRVNYYSVPTDTNPVFIWGGDSETEGVGGWSEGSWAKLIEPT